MKNIELRSLHSVPFRLPCHSRSAMLARTALLLAHTTLARSLVARTTVPALNTRSSCLCMQANRLTVLVPVAEDSEEIETACITDTLVRAGAEVVVASVMPGLQVRMSRGLKVEADCLIEDCRGKVWDAIALPGGMPGANHLRDSAALKELLLAQSAAGKLTAAICASPAVVFGAHGLLPASATCYPAPAFKDAVSDSSTWEDSKVVVEGHIITSQGPGTSLQFALKIVERLYGEDKAKELAEQMLTTLA